MYLDWHPTAHQRFAAYETNPYDIIVQGINANTDAIQKEIEQKYQLGRDQIAGQVKAATIQANASRANAKTSANAQIKSTGISAQAQRDVATINQATSKYSVDVGAAVDRENIQNTLNMKRMDIAQAREEMLRMGIPEVNIKAWTAQKNYELAKAGIALDVIKTDVAYRNSPDRYWMAADFEQAIPALLNGTDLAGGGMNGPTESPSGAPKPNSLSDLVAQLGGGTLGTQPTTGTGTPGNTGNIYTDTLALTSQEPTMTGLTAGPATVPTGVAPAGAGATAVSGTQNGKGWIDALTQQGIQAWGGLDLTNYKVTQADVDNWFNFLRSAGNVDPNDPRVKAAAEAARANGFNTAAYDAWNPTAVAPAPASPAPAPVAAAPAATTTAAPAQSVLSTNPLAGYTQQDATMLSGISSAFSAGLDPFVLDKLNPTQKSILMAGGARLGYDPNAELFKAEARRPGQGNPLAA